MLFKFLQTQFEVNLSYINQQIVGNSVKKKKEKPQKINSGLSPSLD